MCHGGKEWRKGKSVATLEGCAIVLARGNESQGDMEKNEIKD